MKLNNNKIIYAVAGSVALLSLVFLLLAPAFAGKIKINPTLEIGSLQIRWYGLIMATAILISYLLARKNSWKFGISKKDVDDYSFWLVIVGLLGARIYFIIFTWDFYVQHLEEIYKIWHGGLAIYGAIISGIVFTHFYVKRKAYSFFQLFDLVALSLPLGQAIGRFGNFFNQEAYGTVTDLPWKMYIEANDSFHHPAFLYEAIFDLLIFFVLYRFLGKVKSGTLGLWYLLLYSFVRFFIEGIRLDSFVISGFRVDQVVAFLVFIISGGLILRMRAKN
jgi:phosphatidylglycerol:prolipoprotein diacylglycerol transferase